MNEKEYYTKKLENEIKAFEWQEKENERLRNIPNYYLWGMVIFGLIIGIIAFKMLMVLFDVIIFGIFS